MRTCMHTTSISMLPKYCQILLALNPACNISFVLPCTRAMQIAYWCLVEISLQALPYRCRIPALLYLPRPQPAHSSTSSQGFRITLMQPSCSTHALM